MDDSLLYRNSDDKHKENYEKLKKIAEENKILISKDIENKLKEYGVYDKIMQDIQKRNSLVETTNSDNTNTQNPNNISEEPKQGDSDLGFSPQKKPDFYQKENKFIPTTNSSYTLSIHYATEGRFSIPAIVRWRDYSVKDITDLSIVNEDTFLDVLVDILNQMNKENINTEDMLLWELYQTLIELKRNFISEKHIHFWFCECQNKENDKKISKGEIDLNILQYKYINEYDQEIKKEWEKTLQYLTDEEKKQILGNRTEEEFLNNIKIKEPFRFQFDEGIEIIARFVRVGDMKEAIRESIKLYKPKYSSIETQIYKYTKSGNVDQVLKLRQQKEELDKERALFIMLYSRAKSILDLKIQGREELYFKDRSMKDKIEILESLPRNVIYYVGNYLDGINFFQDIEVDLECELCGKKNTKTFPRDFNLLELLPYSSDKDVSTEYRPKIHRNVKVLFGV